MNNFNKGPCYPNMSRPTSWAGPIKNDQYCILQFDRKGTLRRSGNRYSFTSFCFIIHILSVLTVKV
jgi:hypothetical protein